MKVLAEERQELILQMLRENNVVKIQDICEKSGCSESSARRDLQLLEENNLLVRIHGGAKVKYSLSSEPDMTGKARQNTTEKNAIAKAAASRLREGDVVYLDAGTSTLALIQYLEPSAHLTVVTNGVVHASMLADKGVRTILVGGELKNTTKAIVGVEAVNSLKQYRFNKVFMGINGIHPQYGYTTPDPDEAAVKQVAMEQSEQCFILADHTKFDEVSFVKVADVAQASVITTKLPAKVSSQYNKQTTIQEVEQ